MNALQKNLDPDEIPTQHIHTVTPLSSLKERMLTYNGALGRWEGGTKERAVFIDKAAFGRYVQAYLDVHGLLPVPENVQLGIDHCSRLAFWDHCECYYDAGVSVRFSSLQDDSYHRYRRDCVTHIRRFLNAPKASQ